MAKSHASGGHMVGKETLSPMDEDFKEGSSHDCAGRCEVNGVPGYPEGSERIAEEVTYYEGGNFGTVKRTKDTR